MTGQKHRQNKKFASNDNWKSLLGLTENAIKNVNHIYYETQTCNDHTTADAC